MSISEVSIKWLAFQINKFLDGFLSKLSDIFLEIKVYSVYTEVCLNIYCGPMLKLNYLTFFNVV